MFPGVFELQLWVDAWEWELNWDLETSGWFIAGNLSKRITAKWHLFARWTWCLFSKASSSLLVPMLEFCFTWSLSDRHNCGWDKFFLEPLFFILLMKSHFTGPKTPFWANFGQGVLLYLAIIEWKFSRCLAFWLPHAVSSTPERTTPTARNVFPAWWEIMYMSVNTDTWDPGGLCAWFVLVLGCRKLWSGRLSFVQKLFVMKEIVSVSFFWMGLHGSIPAYTSRMGTARAKRFWTWQGCHSGKRWDDMRVSWGGGCLEKPPHFRMNLCVPWRDVFWEILKKGTVPASMIHSAVI